MIFSLAQSHIPKHLTSQSEPEFEMYFFIDNEVYYCRNRTHSITEQHLSDCHSISPSTPLPYSFIPHLNIMLSQQRLSQLDILGIRLLRACAGVHNLLPLVVLGLALCDALV
jgi:hypothetical protein